MPTELWRRLKPEARRMRRKPTVSEDLLWQRLRRIEFSGAKWRRQHVIEPFIVDFYCARARLVVEIDGPVHLRTRREDEVRQRNLEQRGLLILRFTASAVIADAEGVAATIATAVRSRIQ